MLRKKQVYKLISAQAVGLLSLFIAASFLFSSCLPLARTVNLIPSAKIMNIDFTEEFNSDFKFYYSDTLNNLYLRDLRRNYALDSLTASANNQLDKVKILLNWSNSQWSHSVGNTPKKTDAISILEEVKKGSNFRCVEYGIVSAAALNSINLPSRVLGLKTRDVEKVKLAAGHVVAEVFLNDYNKWVFIDGQMNIIPILNGLPLNAVEFQKAIVENKENLELVNIIGAIDESKKEKYLEFVSKYLYYFDISFDNRYGYNTIKDTVNEHYKLTLVPLNAGNPKIFQRKYKIKSNYSNSINVFYVEPLIFQ